VNLTPHLYVEHRLRFKYISNSQCDLLAHTGATSLCPLVLGLGNINLKCFSVQEKGEKRGSGNYLTDNEKDGKGMQKEGEKEKFTKGREYTASNGERR
jgi:hypothetical protein